MATYDVKVSVTYFYEVQADSDEEAEKQGWMYEDYAHFAEVEDISVSEQEEDEEEEEEEEIEVDDE
jgi:hypothetical protein